MRRVFLPLLTLSLVGAWCGHVLADEPSTTAEGGDPRLVEFVVPFERALEIAKEENRLLFLKPIYGGVDEAGYRDYRCGSW